MRFLLRFVDSCGANLHGFGILHVFGIKYQSVPGVPEIKEGQNPATWMLEVSTPAMEAQLSVDFSEIYASSELYRRNQELIKQLSTPTPGSQDVYFPTHYAQSFITQCKACFWKQHLSYWRNPKYKSIRFFMTTVIGIIFRVIFWDKGQKMKAILLNPGTTN